MHGDAKKMERLMLEGTLRDRILNHIIRTRKGVRNIGEPILYLKCTEQENGGMKVKT